MSKSNNDILVEVKALAVHYPVKAGKFFKKKIGAIKAVDGVSFKIRQGTTLGLVGESGSGKTTTGTALLQIEKPTSGQIFFKGRDITHLPKKEIRPLRRHMQMIFQDPYSSLDPRMRIRDIVGEPLVVHGMTTSRSDYREQAAELLRMVGLNPNMMERYPHEFSGGQRQRIGVARALAVKPDFIVCDEAVSALDVSIQAQIINLLEALQERLNLTFLFIAHDLAVVRHISAEIAVMYLGKIVEIASRAALYQDPRHPYTQALLSAVPIPNPRIEAQRKHILLQGEMPIPFNPPPGCRFHTRCPEAIAECYSIEPQLREYDAGHWVACHGA